MSGRRMAGLAVVILLHIALGYAFLTGLAFNVIKKTVKDLKTFDVTEPPPPPPEQPPPPPETPKEVPPPPLVSPPPIVRTPTIVAPQIVTVPVAPPPVITPTAPVAPPPPPPAPKPSQAVASKPRGDPSQWVTTDDYPSASLRNEEQGVTGFKLDVDGTGKATNCTVTSSSGSSALDDTACRLLLRRARFSPAKDAAGNGLPSVYNSRVRWQIPKD